MGAKLVTQIYEMEENGNYMSGRRAAKICFVNGKFDVCEYSVSELKRYTLKDWAFLKEVASEIERLVKEVGNDK